MRLVIMAVFVALISACGTLGERAPTGWAAPPQTAWIVGRDGQAVGQARFAAATEGVVIRLEFEQGALPPGWHGVHLHQVGDCGDFAAGFAAAGPHIGAHEDVRHGLLEQAGPEAGDLPNLYASTSSTFGVEFIASRVTLAATPAVRTFGAPERAPLLDADGSALIIHAAPDDHTSQPIGGAGARIACAAITATP